MKYSAKQFLDFLYESYHAVDSIWQMKSDVSYFITELIQTLGGRKIKEEFFNSEGINLYTYEIKGVKFIVSFFDTKLHPEIHRATSYIFVDHSQLDNLFNNLWEIQMDLEDAKRVFIIRRREIKRDIQSDFKAPDLLFQHIERILGSTNVAYKTVQFGWRATQKLGRVETKKPVLIEQPEWTNLMSYGLEFASTLEMLKNGTLAFKVPVWAVEARNPSNQPRKMYAEKNLDYTGRFVIGRKDSVIRWWDFYTNSSRRLYWSQGDNLTRLDDYKGAFNKLTSIMKRNSVENQEHDYKVNQRGRKSIMVPKPTVFPNFLFKDGWDDNGLDNNRIDQATSNAIDDLWG